MLDSLQNIWDLAKDNLTTEEIKSMLIATDSDGNTDWHLATKRCEQDVCNKMWDLAKEILTTDEIKNNLLKATDSEGNTAWYLTAERLGKRNALQKICIW
jgi:hypothetical protein